MGASGKIWLQQKDGDTDIALILRLYLRTFSRSKTERPFNRTRKNSADRGSVSTNDRFQEHCLEKERGEHGETVRPLALKL